MTQNTGSDFSPGSIGSPIHIGFQCDGKSVIVTFYKGEQQLGPSKTFSRAEAIERGKIAAETGVYEYLPIDMCTDDVRRIGVRLREYGETGR